MNGVSICVKLSWTLLLNTSIINQAKIVFFTVPSSTQMLIRKMMPLCSWFVYLMSISLLVNLSEKSVTERKEKKEIFYCNITWYCCYFYAQVLLAWRQRSAFKAVHHHQQEEALREAQLHLDRGTICITVFARFNIQYYTFPRFSLGDQESISIYCLSIYPSIHLTIMFSFYIQYYIDISVFFINYWKIWHLESKYISNVLF